MGVSGILLAGLLPLAWAGPDGTWTFATGADFSSGRYGESIRTDTWYLPVSAKYDAESWNLKLTIPYVTTRGPGNVKGSGADRVETGTVGAVRKSTQGLGDVVLSGGHEVWESAAAGWSVDLLGKIKFGTGDSAKGLGTGKSDFTVAVETTKALGAHALFASIGRRKMGDPEGTDFRDPWLASAGWSVRLGPTVSAGLVTDYRQRLTATGVSARDVTGFVTTKLGGGWKIQTYAVAGMSRSSPDLGVGVQIFYTP